MKKSSLFVFGSLVCNLFVVIAYTYCAIHFFTNSSLSSSIDYFRYFTNLSNLLMAVLCLIYIPFNIINIIKRKDSYPFILRIFKFIGTIGVTITFLTVMFFLGPTQGYSLMLQSDMIFMHLLNPVIALLGLLFFESNEIFKWPYSILGISTVFVYGIVYCINVLGTKAWKDFYGLNINNMGVLMYFIFLAFTFGIVQGIYFLQKLIHNKIRIKFQ